MPVEINTFHRTGTGGKAHIKVSGSTFNEAGKEFLEAVKFVKDSGWVEDSNFGAAQATFGGPPPNQPPQSPPQSPNALVCVEDGSTIVGETVQGTRYSAEQLASGRDKKSRELGLSPVGPRCADCWKRGGYASRYKALRGFSS